MDSTEQGFALSFKLKLAMLVVTKEGIEEMPLG